MEGIGTYLFAWSGDSFAFICFKQKLWKVVTHKLDSTAMRGFQSDHDSKPYRTLGLEFNSLQRRGTRGFHLTRFGTKDKLKWISRRKYGLQVQLDLSALTPGWVEISLTKLHPPHQLSCLYSLAEDSAQKDYSDTRSYKQAFNNVTATKIKRLQPRGREFSNKLDAIAASPENVHFPLCWGTLTVPEKRCGGTWYCGRESMTSMTETSSKRISKISSTGRNVLGARRTVGWTSTRPRFLSRLFTCSQTIPSRSE